MVVLYKYIPAWGLPDISPFCIKVETYLRLAKLPYRAALGDPRKAPKRKLPYIEHAGRTVADSSLIIDYLKEHFGDPLDESLTPRERALCRAVQSMLEEHLYFVTLYLRWQDERGWATYENTLREYARAGKIPSFMHSVLLPLIRRDVIKSLKGQGMGRHSVTEVNAMGVRLVHSISELLGEGPYFLGRRPSSVDASVYASLASLLYPPFESQVRQSARSTPNIVSYCERLKAELYETD